MPHGLVRGSYQKIMNQNVLGQTALKAHDWQEWLTEGGKLEEVQSQNQFPPLVDLRDVKFVEGVGLVRINNYRNFMQTNLLGEISNSETRKF